jgi:sterol desaturase/sphingolipid hydroxylase (fatty acid hydroxylase superfamily)
MHDLTQTLLRFIKLLTFFPEEQQLEKKEHMDIFSLENGKWAYRADFALYSAAVLLLASFLALDAPHPQHLEMACMALAGLPGWSVIEYVLHRFVLHGVQPFQGWHAAHHERPSALISAPTVLSASLILMLVFMPAWLVTDAWSASALTLGVLTGYLAYAVTHHATHHWRGNSAWLKRRKHWHALHHHRIGQPGCFGVTSAFWDHVFRSKCQ